MIVKYGPHQAHSLSTHADRQGVDMSFTVFVCVCVCLFVQLLIYLLRIKLV